MVRVLDIFKIFLNGVYIWISADCKAPMAIPRATAAYLSTLEESVVTYVCNPGTVSEGDNTAVCLHDGKWTDTNLYCRRKYSFARFKKLGNIFQMFFFIIFHTSIQFIIKP